MLSLEEALEKILAATTRLPTRDTPLADAVGQIVAEVVHAPMDLPPFDNASVDGYAVRASDLASATQERPVALRFIDSISAGIEAAQALAPGTCARIFTGAMLPPGADAVVMQEDVQPDADASGIIHFAEAAHPWENIRFRGEDVKQGVAVTRVASWLTPQRAALLAALGVSSVRTQPAPRLGLIATGNELREPGAPLLPGQIYESNRLTLAAFTKRCRGAPKIYPLVPDDLATTKAALKLAFEECDAVVTTGGVSVGEMDFVKAAFAELGGQMDFWKIALKPGKPFAFGQWNGKLLFGLPGNPVSAFVTFFLLVAPAVQRMLGHTTPALPHHSATLAEALENPGDRRHFMRVIVGKDGVHLAGRQASHLLSSLARANGLVDVPPHTALPAGATVTVLHW